MTEVAQTMAEKFKELEKEFPQFHNAERWAIENKATPFEGFNSSFRGNWFKFEDGSIASIDPAFGKDHVIVDIEETENPISAS